MGCLKDYAKLEELRAKKWSTSFSEQLFRRLPHQLLLITMVLMLSRVQFALLELGRYSVFRKKKKPRSQTGLPVVERSRRLTNDKAFG